MNADGLTPPSATQRVLADVALERARQDGKWGADSIVNRSVERGLTVLTEEVGEVAEALLDLEERSTTRAELVQVAAVAVAAIEALDAGARLLSPDSERVKALEAVLLRAARIIEVALWTEDGLDGSDDGALEEIAGALGITTEELAAATGPWVESDERCRICEGSGRAPSVPGIVAKCPGCDGSGLETIRRDMRPLEERRS